MMFPSDPAAYSLEPFVNHFCTATPTNAPEAHGFSRTTMTQPGVYFTLNAPFVKIIGLYSNTGETTGTISGGKAGPAQLSFLNTQLKSVAADRKANKQYALILAVHHPPFTGSSEHFPSPQMLSEIDSACTAAKVYPDLVLSGHAHLYERYTRFVGSKQIPYIVAGNGGYFNLPGFKTGKNGSLPKPNVMGTDGKGNPLRLDHFNDDHFGFVRVNVTASTITCDFFEINDPGGTTAADDHFVLQLNKYSDSEVS